MYAVTGITGQVGGVTGRALIKAGLSVRAVSCAMRALARRLEEVWLRGRPCRHE